MCNKFCLLTILLVIVPIWLFSQTTIGCGADWFNGDNFCETVIIYCNGKPDRNCDNWCGNCVLCVRKTDNKPRCSCSYCGQAVC